MRNKAIKIGLTCMCGTFCVLLCGCTAQLDDSPLAAQADFSVNIALPYATVSPPPAQQEETQALVIDSEGSVTVNDSSSILQDDNATASEAQSNYKSLRQGNTGLAVQALQTRLKELGYYTQDVSGIFDAETEAAVRRFEQTYGTMQTGVATADFQARLFSSDALVYATEEYNQAVISQYKVLQRGDVGSSVYALQQRLKTLGYPITNLTGTYDNETANAVMLFYEAYGLTASDVANVALQREIYSDSARPYGDGEVSSPGSDSLSVMSQEDISAIQQRLIELGYLSGSATGELDDATRTAAKLFEQACGQLPSGALNEDLLGMLTGESAPRFEDYAAQYSNLLEGSSGDAVTQLQTRLVELGYATGTPNGSYGSATTASVKLFQAQNGLEQTGVANVYTQAVLYSSFALDVNGETAISSMPEATAEPEMPASTVQTRLSIGSTGDEVLNLQNRLTELGYVSSITGTYDALTSRAVSALQTCIGLQPDGEVDSGLLAFIYTDAVPRSGIRFHDEVQPYRGLTVGDSGDDVTALQKRLWELGYLEKDAIRDSVGTYNQATAQSVSALQSALGYAQADGIASAELQCYLFSEYSDPAGSAE